MSIEYVGNETKTTIEATEPCFKDEAFKGLRDLEEHIMQDGFYGAPLNKAELLSAKHRVEQKLQDVAGACGDDCTMAVTLEDGESDGLFRDPSKIILACREAKVLSADSVEEAIASETTQHANCTECQAGAKASIVEWLGSLPAKKDALDERQRDITYAQARLNEDRNDMFSPPIDTTL